MKQWKNHSTLEINLIFSETWHKRSLYVRGKHVPLKIELDS